MLTKVERENWLDELKVQAESMRCHAKWVLSSDDKDCEGCIWTKDYPDCVVRMYTSSADLLDMVAFELWRDGRDKDA